MAPIPPSVRGTPAEPWRPSISVAYNGCRSAAVIQWQNASFPSWTSPVRIRSAAPTSAGYGIPRDRLTCLDLPISASGADGRRAYVGRCRCRRAARAGARASAGSDRARVARPRGERRRRCGCVGGRAAWPRREVNRSVARLRSRAGGAGGRNGHGTVAAGADQEQALRGARILVAGPAPGPARWQQRQRIEERTGDGVLAVGLR